ncbi:unnamed protein product, partial [Callosobruchus maculatus]
VPGYTSEWITPWDDDLEKKSGRLELSGVGGSWGALRLRCEATLFHLYRANSLEVEVRPDMPQPASVLLMGPRNADRRSAAVSLPLLVLVGGYGILSLLLLSFKSVKHNAAHIVCLGIIFQVEFTFENRTYKDLKDLEWMFDVT